MSGYLKEMILIKDVCLQRMQSEFMIELLMDNNKDIFTSGRMAGWIDSTN